MDEMLGYIFGSMKSSEKNIKAINKTLKTQRRFNGGMIFALVGTAVCISTVRDRVKEQNEKIKKLEKRIDELSASNETKEREFTKGE